MVVSIILIIISFIMDGVLTNFLPYNINSLSLFTPLLTVTILVLIYPFFYHKEKQYFIISIILGFIYDLFYTNLLFYDAIIFLLLAYIITKLYKVIGDNY